MPALPVQRIWPRSSCASARTCRVYTATACVLRLNTSATICPGIGRGVTWNPVMGTAAGGAVERTRRCVPAPGAATEGDCDARRASADLGLVLAVRRRVGDRPRRALFVPLTLPASVCQCKALRRGITTVCTLDRTMPLACSRADCNAALVCKCDDSRRPLPAPLRLVP